MIKAVASIRALAQAPLMAQVAITNTILSLTPTTWATGLITACLNQDSRAKVTP